jgi:hypothetical protein
MKKWILGIWLFHLIGGFLFAQGEIKGQARIFYRNEKSFGISLNSNGIGVRLIPNDFSFL